MKKGFFLLEALLACVLLSLLVGSLVHHYAQWSWSYKHAIGRSKALDELMKYIELRLTSSPEKNLNITTKNITMPAPHSSVPTFICPPAQCMEITASWRDDLDESTAMSVIVGGHYES